MVGTGNDDVGKDQGKDLMVDAAGLSPTIAPRDPTHVIANTTVATPQQTSRCLRDNECSPQQLVRLIGSRSPPVTPLSWERLRQQQAQFTAS
ncbi:hypothetical protein RPMA_13570 [Tardiphaga alba]|uniref:Uncharacterized protein n=1 Tax=Tardiphaga alba TaxID=340268 RepID=A0ABX8ABE8_9BRAD|nr:hypothetical protein [Tardiphaga alba]QUS39753.1 hypothetical protein RPMA_13570 [Tardiphaga alba]